MKKATSLVALCVLCTSCATVFTSKITDYQKTKPAPGQPKREVRPGFLVADILLSGPVGVAIDFATGAIYKPIPTSEKSKTGTTVSN